MESLRHPGPGLSREQVGEFEFVSSQFDRFHSELHRLAKGKANDGLSTFKLELLNKLLARANSLLGSDYEAISGFALFDPDLVPSVSDALLVLSQYLGALEKLRADNITEVHGEWYWVIGGECSEVRTPPPIKLGRR